MLEEAGTRELNRLARYGHPVSLVFCDIDYFKLVNDSHGHVVGDQVLKQFAARLARATGSVDLVGRIGGEEFAVLLPNTGVTGARVVAERLRAVVADPAFAPVGRISASFGVAQAAVGDDWQRWYGRADAAMYDAKRGGRNRVVVAPVPAADAALESLAGGFMQLVWRDQYRSGHPLIDRQHQALFVTANELLGAAADGGTPDLAPLLTLLVDDCRQHFLDEERVLRDRGYAGLEAHAAVHVELLSQAQALARRCASGVVDLGTLVSFIVRDLVAGHMLREDRKHFPLFA